MKKSTLTLFVLTFSIIAYSQSKIDFSKIDSNDPKMDVYQLKEGDADFQIIFENVDDQDKSTIEGYKYFLDDDEKQISSFSDANSFNASKKTYTLNLSTMLENDIEKALTPFTIRAGGKMIYNLEIKNVEEGESRGDKNPQTLTQTQIQMAIEKSFKKQLFPNLKKELGLKETKFAYVDKKNVIHIFMDMYGKFYGPGIPTAATEKNRFQFHILLTSEQVEEYSFEALYTGEYNPQILSILNTKSVISPESDKEKPLEIQSWDGAVKGPFTDLFSVEITRKKRNGIDTKIIVDADINIAKLYHVSISTGLFATTLRNPQNIEMAQLPSGETTLIADDPSTRGALTIMATFFPKGRSFLIPPEGSFLGNHRFGIQVGAQLNEKPAENFFLGLSHDFARGGAISYGLHYGQRNYVAGKRDFDFGSDVYDLPELNVKKEWNVGFYFGVVIDTRIAIELIKGLTSNQ